MKRPDLAGFIVRRGWFAPILPPTTPPDIKYAIHSRRARILLRVLGILLVVGLGAGAWLTLSYAPGLAASYLHDGSQMLRPGMYPRAIDSLTRSISLRGNNPEAYLLRGEAYQALEDYDRAIQDYTRAIDLAPRLAPAYLLRGSTYRKKGEYDKAIEDLTASIEMAPTSGNHLERALTYTALKRWAAASNDLDRAIEIRPDIPDFYRARSFVRKQLGDLEGSNADRQAATRIDGQP